MFTLLGPSLAALAFGLLARGSPRGLGRTTIVGWPVVMVGIAVEWLLQQQSISRIHLDGSLGPLDLGG